MKTDTRCDFMVGRSSYGYPRQCYDPREVKPVKIRSQIVHGCGKHRAMLANGGKPKIAGSK